MLIAGKQRISYQNYSEAHTRNLHLLDPWLWIIVSGQAGAYVCSMLIFSFPTLFFFVVFDRVLPFSAILGFCGNLALAEEEPIKSKPGDSIDESGNSGLERIEDGSVVSNIHTSKWRVFTDSGRDYFFQVDN